MTETELVNMSEHGRDGVTPIDRSSSIGNSNVLKKDGGDYTRAESVMAYARELDEQLNDPEYSQGLADDELREYLEDLRGETLGCWCAPQLCHGHVVLFWLDQGRVPEDVDELREWGAPERTTIESDQ